MKYIHLIFVAIIIFSIPFIVNAWKGYFMPSKDSEVYELVNDDVMGDLGMRLDEIVSVLRQQGKGASLSQSLSTSQNKRGVRSVYREIDPKLCSFIDEQVEILTMQASDILGVRVTQALCEEDQFCWYTKMYDTPGDFISWHFDNNFTTGSRYTMVCNIYTSQENESHFLTRDGKGSVKVHISKSGKGLLYDGSITKHAISRQSEEGTRLVLIIPLYDNYTKTWFGKWRQWARDVSFQILGL